MQHSSMHKLALSAPDKANIRMFAGMFARLKFAREYPSQEREKGHEGSWKFIFQQTLRIERDLKSY